MVPYVPSRIYVQEESWGDPATAEIVERLRGVPLRTIRHVESILPELRASSDFHASGKRTLILTRNLGNFMKECPGGGAEFCCNYFVINFALNCPMDCTYCVLQAFLNNPAVTVFTNVDDLTREVRERLQHMPERTFRIGTGETADSLALDSITLFSQRLVPFFASLSNGVLELKTKSDQVDHLKGLQHGGRTIISWSLNSKRIIRSEELKTTALEARLAAARKCQEWGYRVGFHFDPLIYYDGWREDYEEVVNEMFRRVDPAGIAWISLGCLRFTPHLREIVRRRFPRSKVPYGEFVPGNHGKLRYFRPIREEMYTKMRTWIERQAPHVFVYLCMENRAVWERSFSRIPESAGALSCYLDSLVRIQEPV